MRDETVARNYAETLFELAERHEGVEAYGEGIETVAVLIDENDDFRLFLETPRIALVKKKELVRRVFADRIPARLVNFVLITLDKRRQRLLRGIAREYRSLLDVHFKRVHIEVTLARAMDESSVTEMQERLTAALGQTAIPHIRIKPAILGGAIFRTSNTIYDGSLRRKLDGMRRRLLKTDLPTLGETSVSAFFPQYLAVPMVDHCGVGPNAGPYETNPGAFSKFCETSPIWKRPR